MGNPEFLLTPYLETIEDKMWTSTQLWAESVGVLCAVGLGLEHY